MIVDVVDVVVVAVAVAVAVAAAVAVAVAAAAAVVAAAVAAAVVVVVVQCFHFVLEFCIGTLRAANVMECVHASAPFGMRIMGKS